MRLLTWIIEYADGMYQEADAINRKAAREQATHGAKILGVWTRNEWNDRREATRSDRREMR